MYLLVFVTMVIALTGIYAESLAVQTARLYSHQTALANVMLEWHETAVAQATYAVSVQPTAAGCSLTTNAPSGIPLCTGIAGSVAIDGTPNLLPCSGSLKISCWSYLPSGYKTSPYTFYSIYYQPTPNQFYVVTYVPPPTVSVTNPTAFLTLPGTTGVQIGSTMSDLYAQIKNQGLSPMAYGFVATLAGTNVFSTASLSNGVSATTFTYTLPAAATAPLNATLPAGSIAILSSL